ncbi:hypothetical protein DW005_12955 [Clostridium sp. AF36-4]|nr:hypothetical protein DW005_12955 [Clostridium sp. AF36-4]
MHQVFVHIFSISINQQKRLLDATHPTCETQEKVLPHRSHTPRAKKEVHLSRDKLNFFQTVDKVHDKCRGFFSY